MNRFAITAVLALSTALSGCNLAPNYTRPGAVVPPSFPQGGPYPRAKTDAPDVTKIGWRAFFTDPRLQAVIDAGLANNRDLRIAAGNVLQARAQYRVQRADLLPTVNATGGATFTNNALGAGGGAGAVGAGAGAGAGTGATGGGSTDFQIYQGQIGISAFELDLFGRIRNLSRAAQEQYFASEEAQRAARISLIAEIATAWLTMASDQEQLRLSRETLKAFAETSRLTRAQFEIGVASELEARQADTNYQGTRNDIAALTAKIAQDKNALDLLVGAPVATEQLPNGLAANRLTREALPGNLDSSILLSRPDVLQAEHQLIAQNANIGAARAAFFPQISLTAALGTISTALSGLFSGGSYTYSVGPTIGLPLFDAGRNKGNLDYARASQVVAQATYERAVQTAFREVADALAQRGTIEEQVSAQSARVNSAEVAGRLSDARYRAGVDSFLVALDAQRTAYAARLQLVTTRLTQESNMVELYRALGGGLAEPTPR
ncbi:efflux transporter outer membrane subunit [Sphingomonas aliaeris]|uniref:Efflux transporter outer membrane subunit n=1 Tax=Sphingomonas aliaeris TaxID=2759526 RepID=A0A974S3N5_9SPHN|nr:efflux transporter outer membrane subunit [Sphingomonas aliaeris]QQV76723.1 efflux transporter outer membrane subunit [Sphingomonas aliaeris]